MIQRAERALPRGGRAVERRLLWSRALVVALRVQALRDAQVCVGSRLASQVVALWEHDPDEVNHSTGVSTWIKEEEDTGDWYPRG